MSLSRATQVVAFCYVAIKPNGQKNDVRCEYTRGALEPYRCIFRLIYKPTNRDYFCGCGT